MPIPLTHTLLTLAAVTVLRTVVAFPQPSPKLDPATRAAVLGRVQAELVRRYVDADTGRLIAQVLQQRQQSGGYDSLVDPAAFAGAVTRDLRSVNNDKHLSLIAAPPNREAGGPPGPGPGPIFVGPTGGDDKEQQRQAQRANYGLRKVEVLEGNIGYLEVVGFLEGRGVGGAIAAALRFLERTDAVIIDLRRNGGGSGEMSHLLFSHFLAAKPVPTIRVRNRLEGTDEILKSLATVPGPRRTTVPLYVLTSNFSASAAEEFAFVLKNQGRATIVGERTAGAGHMNQFVDVGNRFSLSVSFTRVSDARTGAEWEQVGVEPEVAAESGRALQVALEHARKRIAETAGSAPTRRPPG